MKNTASPFTALARLALAAALCVAVKAPAARAADTALEAKFPYVIPVEVGLSNVTEGNAITITSLRGNRPHLEPDGDYLVEGTYTLQSAGSADLLFSCSTSKAVGPTPLTAAQKTRVVRGTGSFSLQHAAPGDGWLHLVFYPTPAAHSPGDIYFGEAGVEKTILRGPDQPVHSPRGNKTPQTTASGANRVILEYLGDPVPPPPGLDAKYTTTGLLAAFTELGAKELWKIQKLGADDSEYPFLIYGVLGGEIHIEADAIHQMSGYDYGGSVVGRSSGFTYFAVNMTPQDRYPEGGSSTCNRRLTVRLQMLEEKAHAMVANKL